MSNFLYKKQIYRPFHFIVFLIALFMAGHMEATPSCVYNVSVADSIIVPSAIVKKPVYFSESTERSDIYNSIWGKHYRDLYFVPVTVPSVTLSILFGGVDYVKPADEFHGIYIKDKQDKIYLLKPLGGASSFLQSDFFQDMYNKADFKDTYLDKFIGDAYTIINPYTFLVSDYLAKAADLNTNNPHLFYLPQNVSFDTIADGSKIQDKLISVTDVLEVNSEGNIISTDSLLDVLCRDKANEVDQRFYIRERVFDMLIGDWNKIPENWNWKLCSDGDKNVYRPLVVDRSHAFTKVEGFLFKQMLGVLSLGFISNYDEHIDNIKKFNKLGFTLDVALTAQSDESVWLNEAQFLKDRLTDDVIDKAFQQLPNEIQNEPVINRLKENLLKRRNSLDYLARRYYKELQYNPVIRGTTKGDSIVVNKDTRDNLHINMYDAESGELIFEQYYKRNDTKEIWIYGMNGNDDFKVWGKERNKIPVFLISGKGQNRFQIDKNSNVRIYDYKSKKTHDSIHNARTILTNNRDILRYDYEKTKYHSVSFSPWGVYDSDWGLSLGSFVSFTQYGLNRSPFSYQHRIGYNYLRGFMYKGIFPSYSGKTSVYIDAFIGSPKNFSNFFGFGNNTDGFKDEKRNYNQVSVGQYSLAPSFHVVLNKDQEIIFSSCFETYKVKREEGRYLNLFYDEDNSIFKTKYYVDLSVSYEINKKISPFVSDFSASLATGWKMNMNSISRNFAYMHADISFNFDLSDRLVLATKIKGKALFNNKYDFYHSASTELRGYRDSRFIGQYSFYQYSDLRLDMGKIKNPFAPLKYGLFIGADYGRVWYPPESSNKWHMSYGGGGWLTIINKITTKYSFFGSGDSFRFIFNLGLGF